MHHEQDYLSRKAEDLAERSIVTADETTVIADAARIMRNESTLSIIVTRDNSPVGIVTEKDILYRVVANNIGPFKATLKDVMSSPLITIDGSSLVKDAIIMMRNNNIRRMPITKDNKIVGMLTLISLIGNSAKNAIELPEVYVPSKQTGCPYCGSKFENKQELSSHIDRLHLGSGLLEGDLRQW
jgi:signal-transduction protein with cAMP-binding, CBS, and nucleotidyltransferase domain